MSEPLWVVHRSIRLGAPLLSLVVLLMASPIPAQQTVEVERSQSVGIPVVIPAIETTPPDIVIEPCKVFQIDWTAIELHDLDNDPNGPGGAFFGGMDVRSMFSVDAARFGCFDKKVKEAIDWGTQEARKRFGANWKSEENAKYLDDLIIDYLKDSQLIVQETSGCGSSTLSTRHYEGKCATGTQFVDENCNPVGSVTETVIRQCASSVARVLWFASSPISLVWSPEARVGASVSIVQFPLNPSEPTAKWVWKASSDLPLLVYDPQHSGKITSAYQLFGNWTFGGQRSASATQPEHGSSPLPWRDGYEALGSLDANGDTVVSGKELEALGLWFDENRDGESQLGEVKSLKQVGVRELYYKGGVANTVTKDVELRVGFKRQDSHGREIIGASVDWYSDRSENPGEIFMRQVDAHLNPMEKLETTMPIDKEIDASEKDASEGKSQPGLGRYSGVWDWSFEADDLRDGKRAGLLIITQKDDGTLDGRSIIDAPVSGVGSARSMIYSAVLSGTAVKQGATFTVASEGGIISTKAILADHGNSMRGESVFTAVGGKKTVSYKWVAQKKSAGDGR